MTHTFHSPNRSSGRTPVGKTILRAAACLVWVGGVVLAIATSVCTETVGTVSHTAFSWLNFHTALCAYALYGGLLWIAGALFDRPGTFRRALSSLRDLFPGRRDAKYDFDPDFEVPPHFADNPSASGAPAYEAPHFGTFAGSHSPYADNASENPGGNKPKDFDEFTPDDLPDDMPEDFKPHHWSGRASKFKASHFDGSSPEDFEAPHFDDTASEDFESSDFDGGDSADSSIPNHE